MNVKIIKSAAQARGFYDNPLYDKSKEKPDYYDLFNWSPWGGLGAIIDMQNNSISMFGGSLKEELFDTIYKKIAYLQGVFEDLSEGCGIIRGENWIQFANSPHKVERCKKWINEVARFMCEGKIISSNNENSYLLGITMGGVIRHDIKYYIPICHRVDIHPEVVKFIKNYQFAE